MTKDPINILLVDDQPAKLLTYEAILQDLGENLIKAGSAREALDHLLKEDIAIVLSDVCMPELDGFELARMIRNHPRFQQTAIIFISAVALTDPDHVKGYSYGAVDYEVSSCLRVNRAAPLCGTQILGNVRFWRIPLKNSAVQRHGSAFGIGWSSSA
jgi:CheY-like chemotaxis protein